jgi:hypothetical protein
LYGANPSSNDSSWDKFVVWEQRPALLAIHFRMLLGVGFYLIINLLIDALLGKSILRETEEPD